MRTCLPESTAKRFTEDEVLAATERFDEAYRLGKSRPKAALPSGLCMRPPPPQAPEAVPSACFFGGALDDGSRVAIQVLEDPGPAELCDELLAEQATALGRINHPHLSRFLGWASFWNRHFWVFEFVEGLDFQQLLRGCKLPGDLPFDWALRLRALRDVATGVERLHAELPRMHQPLGLTSILVDRKGFAKVVDYARPDRGEEEQAKGATAAAAVHALGLVALCSLIGEDLAGHKTIGTVPTEPSVLDFVLKSLDGTALWPVGVAKALGELSLRCVQPKEEERPGLTEVVLRLDDLCTQFGLFPQADPDEDAQSWSCSPRRRAPESPLPPRMAVVTAQPQLPEPAAEEGGWFPWLRCCNRSSAAPGQSLPMPPPPTAARGQGYSHFWGSADPEEVEFGKMQL